VIVAGGGGAGEQVAVAPPFKPPQGHVPEVVTAVGVPALHVPPAVPQTPFTGDGGGAGVQSIGVAPGCGGGAVIGLGVGIADAAPGIGQDCEAAGPISATMAARVRKILCIFFPLS